ncbi:MULTISPECIES: hypothetical protein [Stutzerimonas stutzeri group]|jgi:hypothetical protein|uniref:hypothetical protein n=1 Tax=Stutzerimonas stutzeri group TaxID=136846 RepID=UPI000F79DDB2|nr:MULTISPECIES: hypothetical protein [Stutzerimonas stutzeri group]MUT68882.1 hypothetical protein [Stutzerimonas frequens]MUT70385.1 hypothetical protein [Stutzerimonas frequens]RRV38822.1 hypothetical protein EGJ12_08825 [Stutzerimonas stutzeri]RRW31241.1 hypothetical protein EGJ47_01610 [Stutzerimonas stutzeri]
MNANDPQTGDEPDVTMTDAGEKNAGEDPDYDEQPSRLDNPDEPEVLPNDPDILGQDGSDEPS